MEFGMSQILLGCSPAGAIDLAAQNDFRSVVVYQVLSTDLRPPCWSAGGHTETAHAYKRTHLLGGQDIAETECAPVQAGVLKKKII